MAVFGKSFSGKGESGPEKICVLRSGTGFCRIPDGKPRAILPVWGKSAFPLTIPFREMLYPVSFRRVMRLPFMTGFAVPSMQAVLRRDIMPQYTVLAETGKHRLENIAIIAAAAITAAVTVLSMTVFKDPGFHLDLD